SSRRRHTRFSRDWSSDVCSSDLASVFLEPLESTSISLIQTGISKLLQFFPDASFNEHYMAEVNRMHRHEFERIRDFLILHYKATSRCDTEFWRFCQEMPVPDSLAHKMNVFESRGHVVMYEPEAFEKESWVTMYMGFGRDARRYAERADLIELGELKSQLARMRQMIQVAADQAMAHGSFIARHCAAEALTD